MIVAGALSEYFRMAFPGRYADQIVGTALGLAVSLMVILPEIAPTELALGPLLVVIFTICLCWHGDLRDRLWRLASTLLGAMYLGYMLPQWVSLFLLPNGRSWVFFVLAVVITGDTCAYFVGRGFGRRQIAPQISPAKTVEGAVGYIAGSVLAGSVAGTFLAATATWVEVAFLSAVLGVLGQLGDLFESWIKRVFAVKDSGALFPGHGGLLDRLDSLIFPAVFTTAYLKAFHS